MLHMCNFEILDKTTPITSQLLPHTTTGSISSTNYQSTTSAICLIRPPLTDEIRQIPHPALTASVNHHFHLPPHSIYHLIRILPHSSTTSVIHRHYIDVPPSCVYHNHPSTTIIRLSPLSVCHPHAPVYYRYPFATIFCLTPYSVYHHHLSTLSSICHHHPSNSIIREHLIRQPLHPSTTSSIYHRIRLPLPNHPSFQIRLPLPNYP